MKILGIDPGFGLCGFAVLSKEQNELKLENFGVIKTDSKQPFTERLQEIADDFSALLKKHNPDVVSIEDLFFVQNVTTGMQVAHVRGVIMYLAVQHGARIVEPKPVEVKHSFTGDGKADKTAMKQMAKMMFGLEKSPKIDDAADAIAVAHFAAQSLAF